MLVLAFLLGLNPKPVPETVLASERDRKRAALRQMLDDIAERDRC